MGKEISPTLARENKIICQRSPQHISENLSGHILALGKHKWTFAMLQKLCPQETYRGAREGPQKFSVSHADVLTDQPCLKRPCGFSLDDQQELNAPLNLAKCCTVWIVARFRATWVTLLGHFFSNLPNKLHVCGELSHTA